MKEIVDSVSSKRRNTNRTRIKFLTVLVCIISTITTLILVELLLVKFFPQKTLYAANVFSPFCFRNSDYLPFQLQENAECKQIQKEFNIKVHTNSRGYRSKEFEIKKDENKKRILILGDSFGFGYGVEDNQTFSYLLEEKLNEEGNKWEVINASYASGDSPDSYYAYLEKEGFELDPDIVIETLFVGNDFTDLFETEWLITDEKNLPIKIGTVDRFIDNQGRLLHPSMSINYRLPVLKNSHLFQLIFYRLKPKFDKLDYSIKNLLNIEKNKEYAHPEPHVFCIYNEGCVNADQGLNQNINSVIQLIEETNIKVQSKNIEYLLLIIPSDIQLYPEAWKKWGTSVELIESIPVQPQTRLISALRENNIEYLDLLDSFKKYSERLYYPQDAHFNLKGHKYTSELIYEYLKDNKKIINEK